MWLNVSSLIEVQLMKILDLGILEKNVICKTLDLI